MAKASMSIPISQLTKDLTMTISLTGVKTWRVRCWVGLQLMRVAAKIIGVGVDVQLTNQQ